MSLENISSNFIKNLYAENECNFSGNNFYNSDIEDNKLSEPNKGSNLTKYSKYSEVNFSKGIYDQNDMSFTVAKNNEIWRSLPDDYLELKGDFSGYKFKFSKEPNKENEVKIKKVDDFFNKQQEIISKGNASSSSHMPPNLSKHFDGLAKKWGNQQSIA